MARGFSTVAGIEELEIRGPWITKSGGELSVLFAFPPDTLKRFMRHNREELNKIPEDIRGLRSYSVRGLPKDKIGGTEFHRIREELVFGLEGRVLWKCEDIYGGRREFELSSQKGVWVPPFVLHTYHTLEENSGLLVLANTLFNPDDPRTHDTYSREEFRKLQKSIESR